MTRPMSQTMMRLKLACRQCWYGDTAYGVAALDALSTSEMRVVLEPRGLRFRRWFLVESDRALSRDLR